MGIAGNIVLFLCLFIFCWAYWDAGNFGNHKYKKKDNTDDATVELEEDKVVALCENCEFTDKCESYKKHSNNIEGCCDFGAFTEDGDLIEDSEGESETTTK